MLELNVDNFDGESHVMTTVDGIQCWPRDVEGLAFLQRLVLTLLSIFFTSSLTSF